MKKNKLQNQFFEELRKVPIIQVACEKTGLSRNSIYRWRKEDSIFAKNMDEAITDGVALVNDMSESQLLTLIKDKNWPAISFWLRHHHSTYRNRLEVTAVVPQEELTPEQEALVREALRLSATRVNDINNNNDEQRTNIRTNDERNDQGSESPDGDN